MRHIITLAFIITTGCTVSEEMIANKQLYCSGVYKGIRAVGRVATEVTTGVRIPDVCTTIDEITEDSEKKYLTS